MVSDEVAALVEAAAAMHGVVETDLVFEANAAEIHKTRIFKFISRYIYINL